MSTPNTTTPNLDTAEARATALSLADAPADFTASLSSVLVAVEAALDECAAATASALAAINDAHRRGLTAQRSPYGPRP